MGCIGAIWYSGWFELGAEAGARLVGVISTVRGFLLGLILSLIVSGQLIGTKPTNDIPSADPLPNHSPDPTPASVTPAAGQPPRQP